MRRAAALPLLALLLLPLAVAGEGELYLRPGQHVLAGAAIARVLGHNLDGLDPNAAYLLPNGTVLAWFTRGDGVWHYGPVEGGRVERPLLSVRLGWVLAPGPGMEVSCTGALCVYNDLYYRNTLIYNASSGAWWNISSLYRLAYPLAWRGLVDGSVLAALAVYMRAPYRWSEERVVLLRLYPGGSATLEGFLLNTTLDRLKPPMGGGLLYYTYWASSPDHLEGAVAWHDGFAVCSLESCRVYRVGGPAYPIGRAHGWWFAATAGRLYAARGGALFEARLSDTPILVQEAGWDRLGKVAVVQCLGGTVYAVPVSRMEALLTPALEPREAGRPLKPGYMDVEPITWLQEVRTRGRPQPVQWTNPLFTLYWTGNRVVRSVRVVHVTEDLLAILLAAAAALLLLLGLRIPAAAAAAAAAGIAAKGLLMGYGVALALAWSEFWAGPYVWLQSAQVAPVPLLPSRAAAVYEVPAGTKPVAFELPSSGFSGYANTYLATVLLPPDPLLLLLVFLLAGLAAVGGAAAAALAALRQQRRRRGWREELGRAAEVVVEVVVGKRLSSWRRGG
jgi:hypothetical protein